MNKLTLQRRIALTLLALFSSTMLWAQTLTFGSGTENDPYLISSAKDWNAFASDVNDGYSYEGKYLKLTSNITVNINGSESSDKMAGVMTSGPAENKWFSGTFDGDWHTLTFNVGTSSTAYNSGNAYSPNAPFRVIDGATIKNLTVEGTIYSVKKYSAGLVGFAYNAQTSKANNIINCISSIEFYGTYIDNGGNDNKKWDCSAGGFVAENKTGNIYFNNCIFNGQINKGDNTNANRGAGFVSYNNGSTLYFNNCTMAGTIGLTLAGTFYRANTAKHDYSNCYYVTSPTDLNQDQLDANSKQAYTNPSHADLTNKIYKHYNINSNDYYIPSADITGFETTTYSYIADQTITIDAPVVSYYGRTLTRGTDYVIKKKYGEGEYAIVSGDITLSAAGNYDIKIEAKEGSSYGGSQTTTIKVVEFNSWAVLKDYLADDSKGDRVITLSSNITSPNPKSDSALVVKGNVILNLNNKTINRNLSDTVIYGQVIRVKKGANLTINGPGIIKGGYNWPGEGVVPKETTYWPKRDGGGIHNMGNLVLNNVDVIDNKCYKEEDGSTNPTARGGGIYSGAGSSLRINGGSVSSNIGRGGGGGVYCDKADTFVMTGVDVQSNEADSKGGGLRIKTGSAVAYLTDCDISYWNSTSADASQGGGIYLESGELVMTRCNISGNATTMQGGGFFSYNGKTTAIDCTIENNGTYYYDSNVNHGGGICLFDNKGSNHSIYIMDGGVIKDNNCTKDGGGVYIYEGAIFQIKGNVQIYDNLQASMEAGLIGNNNAYLAGESVIEVVGPLGEDATIHITPNGSSGTCVKVAEGVEVETATVLEHLVLDGDDYRLIPSGQNVEIYQPYSWEASGTWGGSAALSPSSDVPEEEDDITINMAVVIPSGAVASANNITLGEYGEIVIEDGAQLIHGNNVRATLQKEISAYTINENNGDSKTDGWYTIASPVTGSYSTEGITTTSYGVYYDLYRYDEPTHFWQNAKGGDGHGFNTLNNGQGYLYAHKPNITLNFTGTMQATNSTVSIPLSYTEDAGDMKGYNLVGNPFTCNITGNAKIVKGATSQDLTTYYYIAAGSELTTTTLSERPIQPGEGFFVQATESGQSLVFNDETPSLAEATNSPALLRIEAGDDLFTDRALLQFGNGNTLRKIIINEDVPHLSLQLGKADYASAAVEAAQGTVPVSFKPATNGTYTITVSPEGVEMGYLHLVDNLTGTDTDLLSSPTYTFSARSDDYASRFRLVYSATQVPEYIEQPASFAFISNGQIILTGVDGNTTLQVMDMTGRVILCRAGACTVSTTGIAPGVYILRLIHNDDVKTQKIIVQ